MSRRYPFILALSMAAISILAFFFEATGLISYGLIIVSVWSAIAIAAVWVIVFALRKAGLLKYSFRFGRGMRFPLLLFITGSVGILVMNLYAPPALPASTFPIGEQLRYMYETDQEDRLALRFRNLNERDWERLERVLEFHEQGNIARPEELYHAATILQHGTASEHYELAYLLAKRASEAGYKNADGLWKSAYDRWMLSLGKPQVYGTQSTAVFTIFGISFEQK
ncbi:MAG: hypothetical protein QY332_10385 [Anaerolineales bacterium]|nr:MAG: hypothetical protein QY332_10385 [Anaerolineales bacterium]